MYPDVKEEGTNCDVTKDNQMRTKQFYHVSNSESSRSGKFRGVFLPMSERSNVTNDSENYCLKRTEGKTALFYEDSNSGRSFRFILHRKNARKADIYACAKCKSRRKYVRIMVQNDKFLCDPASLDHICYMSPIELYNERVKNEGTQQRKTRKLVAELKTIGDTNLEDRNSVVPTSSEPKEVYAGSLLDCSDSTFTNSLAEEQYCVTPSSENVIEAHSVAEGSSSNMFKTETNREMSFIRDELQASEQEPTETKPSPLLRDEVCLQSIKMALEKFLDNGIEMPGTYTFYDGSTVLEPIASYLGIPVDKVNFVLCMFSSLPLAYVFKRFMKPCTVSRQTRTAFPLLIGFLFCFFCFGRATKHLLANCLLNYAIMCFSPERYVHKEIPSLLDYMSYIFNFQTALTGPVNFYSDYLAFLDGVHIVPNKEGELPSPIRASLKKLFESLCYLLIIMTYGSSFPPEIILEKEYLELPYVQWFFWWFIILVLIRVNYYFAWTFADSVCNMSGFGFSGYDEHGVAKWELCTNVKPYQVEMAQSFKETLDGWNIQTGGWLRRVAYDRSSKKIRTVATYMLSALWHGISVGYYITFFTGALFTLAGATFRRCMRHRFLHSKKQKAVYDVMTFVATKIALAYATYAFVMMNLEPAIFVYKRVFFVIHIIALLILFVLPRYFHPKPSERSKQSLDLLDVLPEEIKKGI
ncbi:MBOAT family protein [Dictyocaulus viviparus]|uniref:MBOAT family protein n=1 Tax=Dictyocaulus viviparus TaxID=29172 RepID=A0A0D8XQ11_DICVI|nr:MBOAT family protein [Dictyocaulus viviparus]